MSEMAIEPSLTLVIANQYRSIHLHLQLRLRQPLRLRRRDDLGLAVVKVWDVVGAVILTTNTKRYLVTW
jgi:hypothetical protein